MRQFIPVAVAARIKSDIATDPSVVRGFEFYEVALAVTAEAIDGGTGKSGLGRDEPFMVEN